MNNNELDNLKKRILNLEKLLDNEIKNLEVIETFREKGVLFISTSGIIIDKNAKIGKGTKIYPGTIIEKDVIIGKNCKIGPNAFIKGSKIGNDCIINQAQIYESEILNSVDLGPYVHIRPNTVLKDGVKVGDFVEIKSSTIGEKTTIAHLSYIGDSELGKNINVGCGAITVNYDGKIKHKCIIKDNVFLGCNTVLIAPVTIEEGAYIAASSNITENVPKNALSIGRAKQIIKENWAINKYKR